jgi:hypothetical protein
MDCRPASAFRLLISILAAGVALFAQKAQFTPANDGGADRERIPKQSIVDNEAAVTDICASYVEAQLIYFRSDHDGDGFPAFAQKIRSTHNRRDGLYWAPKFSEDESPMGPKFAAAAVTEEQPRGESRPYFGYYFKILLGQGPEAPGGARDYRVNGRLLTGFALVAWPAEYGVSGVHSFLVNHFGDVYTKDLGSGTRRIASGMSAFAPDRSWTKVVGR